jgi:hypothetical protein
MGPSANESNSFAEESVVCRQFSTRLILQSILERFDNTDTEVHLTRHA